MKCKTLTIVSAFFLLAGCWDMEESDRLDYVHGVGVDYEDGRIMLIFTIGESRWTGNPGNCGKGRRPNNNCTASAVDVNTAIFNIYKSAQKRLYWGHTTFIILSEATLENNKLKEVSRFSQSVILRSIYRIRMFSTKMIFTGLMQLPTFKGSPILSRLT